jgi:hypothetical protein
MPVLVKLSLGLDFSEWAVSIRILLAWGLRERAILQNPIILGRDFLGNGFYDRLWYIGPI